MSTSPAMEVHKIKGFKNAELEVTPETVDTEIIEIAIVILRKKCKIGPM